MKVSKVIKKFLVKKCKSCQNKCPWYNELYEDLERMEVSE